MSRLINITPEITDNWQEIIDDFLLFKQAQGLAERTIADYEYHTSLFFEKYPEIKTYDALEKNVLKYFAQTSRLAVGTFNIRRKYLNTFFRWCVSQGVIPANPIRHIKIRKDEGRIRPIPEDTLKELIELPDKKTYVGLRDYTLILLSLDTGIRPSEALAIVASDINIKAGELFVRPEIAKTGVSRTLPISDEVIPSIVKLAGINEKTWNTDKLFCTCEGRQMTINAWKKRMRVYSKKLGFTISAYDLRHAFAIMYLRNGGDAFTLQRLMGHTDMEMTKRYLKFSQTDLQNAHAGASPLASLLGKKKKIIKI